jgi:hypothetical protein
MGLDVGDVAVFVFEDVLEDLAGGVVGDLGGA